MPTENARSTPDIFWTKMLLSLLCNHQTLQAPNSPRDSRQGGLFHYNRRVGLKPYLSNRYGPYRKLSRAVPTSRLYLTIRIFKITPIRDRELIAKPKRAVRQSVNQSTQSTSQPVIQSLSASSQSENSKSQSIKHVSSEHSFLFRWESSFLLSP